MLIDKDIYNLAVHHGMINGFVSEQVKDFDGRKIVSYGLSSCGYDARLAPSFLVASGAGDVVIDPLDKSWHSSLVEVSNVDSVLVPANGFVLAHTVERFKMPADVAATCVGKSTYARCGLIVNVTPIEPGWGGQVTLELSNTTPHPIRVHAWQGICQFLFHKLNERPAVTYGDRGGKYQNQSGITLAKV